MPQIRIGLAAAVTTVLALTAGAVAVVPASAAGPSVSTGTTAAGQEQAALAYPQKSDLVSAGATGFLTQGEKLLWTRFSDGSTVELPGKPVGDSRSDIVGVLTGHNTVRLYDMAAGGEPVTLDLSDRPGTYVPAAISGSTVAFVVNGEVRLVSKEGDTLTERKVGRDAYVNARVAHMRSGELVVSHLAPAGNQSFPTIDVVDTATGLVTASFGTGPVSLAHVTASGSTLAWWDGHWQVHDRATGTTRETAVPGGGAARVDVLGNWLLSARDHGLTRGDFTDGIPLIARALNGSGTTVRLLDHLESSAVAPDGTVLVRGGTQEHGEGLYRIAVGESGVPTATFLAGSGETTELGDPVFQGPTSITLNGRHTSPKFSWLLNRTNIRVDITLRHTATGKMTRQQVSGRASFFWDGLLYRSAAPTGDYTWEATISSLNGIGAPVRSSGAFTLKHQPEPHDYTSNGSADVIARDTSGRLWIEDSYYFGKVYSGGRTLVGPGWQVYDRIEATGNAGGSVAPDLVARDRSGVLWFYQGDGKAGFAPRVKVGGGWNAYDKIAAGSDLNNDAKPDLLATDKSGGLWLYPGTGNVNAPFGEPKKIGSSWGGYNLITAVGNLLGDPAGDLVARDKDGVLWLYLGKGDGTFAPRVKVGPHWGGYADLVPVVNADGWNYSREVLGVGRDGTFAHLGGNVWTRPFSGRQHTTLFADGIAGYDAFA
ncbi:VCBS repeat-containing protein [Streptomyces sp. NPDC096079]|uniref:FG-GAP repeat domain-containing protein n=1 Tax=Streptomyces sp. NPDC096079 TaxID=3155820 RepID=UPI00332498BC